MIGPDSHCHSITHNIYYLEGRIQAFRLKLLPIASVPKPEFSAPTPPQRLQRSPRRPYSPGASALNTVTKPIQFGTYPDNCLDTFSAVAVVASSSAAVPFPSINSTIVTSLYGRVFSGRPAVCIYLDFGWCCGYTCVSATNLRCWC